MINDEMFADLQVLSRSEFRKKYFQKKLSNKKAFICINKRSAPSNKKRWLIPTLYTNYTCTGKAVDEMDDLFFFLCNKTDIERGYFVSICKTCWALESKSEKENWTKRNIFFSKEEALAYMVINE